MKIKFNKDVTLYNISYAESIFGPFSDQNTIFEKDGDGVNLKLYDGADERIIDDHFWTCLKASNEWYKISYYDYDESTKHLKFELCQKITENRFTTDLIDSTVFTASGVNRYDFEIDKEELINE